MDGKSLDEINTLQKEISDQLEAGEGMDVDYWTAVLALLLASFKKVLEREQERFKLGRDREV